MKKSCGRVDNYIWSMSAGFALGTLCGPGQCGIFENRAGGDPDGICREQYRAGRQGQGEGNALWQKLVKKAPVLRTVFLVIFARYQEQSVQNRKEDRGRDVGRKRCTQEILAQSSRA